ncbi:MAG: ParB/RepB/Spo0J family partition protein [Planctomycetes bacterium]|nr:ParB/RepB/Spo0J family partition protein [Planctomycetota bacterium]
MSVAEVEIGRLVGPRGPVFPDQARQAELRASIRATGLRRPLDVRPREDGNFELLDGALRCGALLELGWARVPVRVHEVDARSGSRLRLVLNSARRRVSPLEEGRAIRHLLDEGESPAQIQAALGRSRSWLSRRLQLLGRLEAGLQTRVEEGELTPALALEIAKAPTLWQERLRQTAVAHSLSSSAAGRLARLLADRNQTREARERALAYPREALARRSPRPLSPTPLADRIADLTRAALDLERLLERARQTGLPQADATATEEALIALGKGLTTLQHETERCHRDPPEPLSPPPGGPLSFPVDRAAAAPPALPKATGRASPRGPCATASSPLGRGSSEALGAQPAPLATALPGDTRGSTGGAGAEGALRPQSLEDGPARAAGGGGQRPREGAAPERQADPQGDRAPGPGASVSPKPRQGLARGGLRQARQAQPDRSALQGAAGACGLGSTALGGGLPKRDLAGRLDALDLAAQRSPP